jgi:hypothetical protein
MPIHQSVPRVTMAEAHDAIIASLEANVACMLIGDPGVGKSALAAAVARALGTPLGILIGSTCDPTDVGGLPVLRVDGKGVDRIPLQLIRKLCDEPGILFIDEVGTAPPAVQAALLRGILERTFGDFTLHPQSRVLAATNPPEQSPGGSDLSAPLIGRVCLLHLRPSQDEVLDYFDELGEEGSRLRAEATDFSVTARVQPDLLEIDIPEAAVQGNQPWGAPRAWERAIRARAVLPEGANKRLIQAVTAGSVGAPLATAFSAIQDIRKYLPSTDDILGDPKGTKVPDDKKHQIGAVGLVARVAERDKWAAYIYADRLAPELRAACGKLLGKKRGQGEGPEANDPSPHRKDGQLARLNILRSIPRAVTR